MSVLSEMYQFINAAYQADTTTGGLNDSLNENPAYVRNMFRVGDTNNETRNWPIVVVSFVNTNEQDYLTTSGRGQRMECLGQFDIITQALNRFVMQDAVVERMRTTFHGFVPAAIIDRWTFGQLVFRDEVQAPNGGQSADGVELSRYIIRFQVNAIRM